MHQAGLCLPVSCRAHWTYHSDLGLSKVFQRSLAFSPHSSSFLLPGRSWHLPSPSLHILHHYGTLATESQPHP